MKIIKEREMRKRYRREKNRLDRSEAERTECQACSHLGQRSRQDERGSTTKIATK